MVQVRNFLVVLSWSVPNFLFGQIGNWVFDDQIIHQISINTPLENWFEVLENDYTLNAQDPNEYPEIYRPCSVTLDGSLIVNSGFREKGNFSNAVNVGARKKPLKIAFDAVIEQSLNGVKKINLHNFTNDPSLIHDALAYSIFRELGIPAPRTAYAQVWVNGEYIGLYLMVENVDKTFLKMYFGSANNDGNLYKTGREAKVYFNDLGDSAVDYQNAGLNLTTNESENDYTQIIDFIQFIQHPERPGFDEELERRFDISSYLNVLAVEKLIRSWDNYWNGGNNFYLYEHPDGQYRWIPWDMNETFQDLRNLSWTTWLDGYWIPYKQMDERPLIAAIFHSEKWKQYYLQLGCELIHGVFSAEHLSERIVQWHNLVAETYRNDPNRHLSMESFERSLFQTHTDQIQLFNTPYALRFHYPGILPLIQNQREWAVDQLKGWEVDCNLNSKRFEVKGYPNPGVAFCTLVLPENEYGKVFKVKVIQSDGVVVKQFPWMILLDKEFNLDMTELVSGSYQIVLFGADGSKGQGVWIKGE